jgi:hypothetical protein
VQVIVSRRDLQSEEDTKLLMEETCKVKPVGGIFHLAMVSFIVYQVSFLQILIHVHLNMQLITIIKFKDNNH